MKDCYRLYLLLLLLTGGSYWLRGQCPAAGSVIITEIGPRTPNDPNAEWFEIFNTTSTAIDLTANTWIISDDDGTSPYTISSVNGTVILPANDFLVFSYGNAFNSSFSPYTTDHVYGALDAIGGVTMTMGGCTDGIAVKCGGNIIAQLVWSGSGDSQCPSSSTGHNSIQTTSVPVAQTANGIIGNSNYSIGAISPGSAGGTFLPVTWLQFTARVQASGVWLLWETTSETDNEGFFVERSRDGQGWETMGFVPGQRASHALASYQFTDTHSHEGLSYYRLKQVDFGGTHSYSSIVSVLWGGRHHSGRIAPNPAKDFFSINGEGIDGEVAYRLYNAQGQLVQTLPAVKSQYVDVGQLPAGVYTLQAWNETGLLWTDKLVVE